MCTSIGSKIPLSKMQTLHLKACTSPWKGYDVPMAPTRLSRPLTSRWLQSQPLVRLHPASVDACADQYSLARETLEVPQKFEEPANVSLVRLGFLGCSPVDPESAISLDTLELYHRLRQRHGQLSIQTMARTLCDLHDVSILSSHARSRSHATQLTYKPYYRDQLSIAFDAYLCILRLVKARMDEALGHNTPHWRAKNACPPCNYRVHPPSSFLGTACTEAPSSSKAKSLCIQKPYTSWTAGSPPSGQQMLASWTSRSSTAPITCRTTMWKCSKTR